MNSWISWIFWILVVVVLIYKSEVHKKVSIPKVGAIPTLEWYKSDYFKTFIGLVGCYVLIGNFWPDLWKLLYKSPLFWWDHVAIFLTFVLLRKDTGTKDKPKKEFTSFGTAVLFILFCGNVYTIYKAQGSGAAKNQTASVPQMPTGPWKPVLLRPQEPEGKDTEEVRKFWKKHYPEAEAEEMVIICRNESGCNQFTDSGKISTNINEDDTRDLGAMQVNEYWWLKEVKQQKDKGDSENIGSYDLNTLDGNLKAALYIRKKYGIERWSGASGNKFTGSGGINFATRTIIAPTDDWSEKMSTPRGFSIRYESDESRVLIKVFPSGNTYKDHNKSNLVIDPPEAIQLKSLGDEPIKAFFKFK